MFPDPKERTFAIGMWMTSLAAGGAIGPLVGGVLLTYFWWGSVFLVPGPVMIALLVLGPMLLPEFRDPKPGPLDIFSAALSLVALLATIYGIKDVAAAGLGWQPVLALTIGLAVGAVFFRRQLKLADPLIDLRLFRSLVFSASVFVNILGTFLAFAAFLFIAQYLQLVLAMGPLEAGLWMLPQAGGFIAGSLLTSTLARRIRPAYVMAA